MSISRRRELVQVTVAAVAAVATALALSPSVAAELPGARVQRAPRVQVAEPDPVPEVLRGDTWLRHHREDLMPYWDIPDALGTPVGNFPSFRGRAGEVLTENTNRGLSTLARQVYGYSLAFMMTGEERYLTYARAGIDWIESRAADPVHGGWFGELDEAGNPTDPLARKDVFDLASLGLAYGMYFNVTRDPRAEEQLLAVRDLLFDKYYDAANNRVLDSLTYDLTTEVDTGDNGGDISNLTVPATAVYLTNTALLTDPARRAQFTDDLRHIVDSLIARHKNTTAVNPANRWWFWGRTGRFGRFNAPATDFGANLKSYQLIHNANKLYPDRPWDALAADRATAIERAWDDEAARWNQRLISFQPGAVERDSVWHIHAEADQTLAALDLSNGFAYSDRLARSAQSWLDVFVDRDPAYPVRETFVRVERTGVETDLRKTHFGKNMLHSHEHALIMYLHGRALEGLPATLHYAFPAGQALTAVAKPYWFDAGAESRVVRGPVEVLPGHRLVDVSFSRIDDVAAQPYPAPEDTTPPSTSAVVTPDANAAGWHRTSVEVSLSATDDVVGVKEIHVQVEDLTGAVAGTAHIDPGDAFTLPALTQEGDYLVSYHAVDALGNAASPQELRVRIDLTPPTITGLPDQPCVLWPPNGEMVPVADVVATDGFSGVDSRVVTATSSDEGGADDVAIDGGRVALRAERYGDGRGRVYTIDAAVTDVAGNVTAAETTCVVPHDQRR